MGKSNCRKQYLLIGLLLISAGLFLFLPDNSFAADSLCAVVKIEIRQELTLERQAFDAHMRINNGLSHIELKDVNVTVNFTDEYGQTVVASSDPDNTDAVFFIRADSVGIGESVNSIWPIDSVAPSSAVDLHWLIIPAPGSSNGLESGKLYNVGATLTYTIGGEENITEVSPDYIYVKPLPELQLDYFLTEEVFGDDAFTTSIEPLIPFTLGVRVKNNGQGTARNLKIDSAQPEIIENEQGLLIGFAIEGSEVNGLPATESLLIDFGDIVPNAAGVGRWIMTCSLSGKFIEFSADISHSDELGGELTSLIKDEDVYPHFLIKDVYVDLPGRDNICDFLATDDNNTDSAFKVFESDCTDTLVSNQSFSSNFFQNAQVGSEVRYTLLTPESMGFIYVQVSDVNGGNKFLKEVIRSDGKQIKLDNAWLSKSRKDPASSGWNYHVNLFDVNTTGSYTFVFDDIVAVPQPPVVMFINEKQRTELQQLSFLVQASDPNITLPSLSAFNLPPGANFIDNGAVETDEYTAEGIFDWTPDVGQAGNYYVTFKASDGLLEDTQSVVIKVCSIADTDCDGMDDDWEILHFGDLTRDGYGDYDGDGISDLDEFLFGTNPTAENGYGPNAPKIVSPALQEEVVVLAPQLVIENSEDPDGDDLTYEFELFSDPECVELVTRIQDIVESQETTSWTISEDLNENSNYYWRVRSSDGIAYSLWTYGAFFVNTLNDLPGDFYISSPGNETYVDTLTPYLEVTNSADADNDTINYTFEVYSDSSLTQLLASVSERIEGPGGTTGWIVSADPPLNDATTYYWKAIAIDEHGAQTETSTAFFAVSISNSSPTAPTILAPEDGTEIISHSIELTMNNATDPDGDLLTYYFELDIINTFDSALKVVSGELEENIDNTSFYVEGLASNTEYFWRVRSSDGISDSSWTTGSFFVNPTNDVPYVPTLRNPGQNAWVHSLTPTLDINSTTDLDNDIIKYWFEIYADPLLVNLIESSECSEAAIDIVTELDDNTRYYWRARAEDEHGALSDWMETATFFVKSYPWMSEPPQITFIEPSVDIITGSDNVTITWDDVDPDSNATISLYYDINDFGENGILIAENLEEDPDESSDSFSWDVSGLELERPWYIYAVISDGNSSVTVYAPGSVTIEGLPINANLYIISNDTMDGSTIFTDNSLTGHLVTANGDVHHGDALMFGGNTAIDFDGFGDYLSFADSDDWDFGTGDFTIDMWVNMTSVADFNGIFSTCEYAGTGYLMCIRGGNFQWQHPATGWLDTGVAPTTGTWQHLAVVRSGSTLAVYVDGVATLAVATVSGEINSQGVGMVIGKLFPALDGWYFDGYMDEITVLKGEARWTADFTPPNNPGMLPEVDTDSDGISDNDETNIYGTDIGIADTDEDGIDDGAELAMWGADWETDFDGDAATYANNLLDPDSDNDGFSDGEEQTADTDPGDDSSYPMPPAFSYDVAPSDLADGPSFDNGHGGEPFGYDPDSLPPQGSSQEGPAGFGSGCFWADVQGSAAGDGVDYTAIRLSPKDILGVADVTISDLTEISYYTKWISDLDWQIKIYTNTLPGQTSGWYGHRFNFERPVPADNEWHQYDTTNDLAVDWIAGVGGDIYPVNVYLTDLAVDYGTETIMYIDIISSYMTASPPGDSYLDGIEMELDSGATASINLISNTVLEVKSNTTDGSTDFIDSSPSSHTITANGDVQHDDFGNNTSIQFDSAGDFLGLVDNENWDFGTGEFTIDLWVNMTSAADYNGILSTCEYAGSGYMLTIKGGNFQWYHPSTDWLDTGISPAIGTWQHLTVVRSGSTLTVYVDGVATPAVTTASGAINSQGSGLVIGKLSPALDGWDFDGHMDEITITKNQARWTADFTPPNSPAGAPAPDTDNDGLSDDDEINIYGTDPGLPDTDNDGIDDGEEAAYWITLKGDWIGAYDADGQDNNLLDADADGDGFNDGEEKTAGSDPSDAGSVPSSIPVSTKFYLQSDTIDGSTIFTDESSSAHTVTANGDVQHTTMGIDTTIALDGSGDFLDVGDHENWDFGTGEFTIDLWVNITSAADYDGILSTCEYAGSGYMLTIKDGNYQWYHPSTDWLDTGISPSIGTWQHLAVVRSGSTLTVYVDGVATPAVTTASGAINSQGSGLVIGKLFPALDGWYFDGFMDEITITKGEARWTEDFSPLNHPSQ